MIDYTRYLNRLQSGDTSSNPFLDFMDMNLEKLGEGYARFTMPIRDEFMQGNGVMQGGLIVAMADETTAHAIMTLMQPNEGIVTVELKNNFIAPALRGRLVAEATVFKKGRSLIIADCLVTGTAGNPISRLTATFMIRRDSEDSQ